MKIVLFSFLCICLLTVVSVTGQDIKEINKHGKIKIKAANNRSGDNTNNLTANNVVSTDNKTLSLKNTSWKFYLTEPINDTTIWRFTEDSSIVQNKMGEVLVYGRFRVSQDSLIFHDDGGRYHCPYYQEGIYKISIKDDWLNLTLIDDECTGRSMIMNNSKLQRVKN